MSRSSSVSCSSSRNGSSQTNLAADGGFAAGGAVRAGAAIWASVHEDLVTRVGSARPEIQSVWHDRGRFDFDLGAVLDECAHLDEAHGRIMRSDDLFICRPKSRQRREIFMLVGHVPGHAHQMLGPGAALGHT